jgi:hypothetical protein
MIAALVEVELHLEPRRLSAVTAALMAAVSSVFPSPAAWKSGFTFLKT